MNKKTVVEARPERWSEPGIQIGARRAVTLGFCFLALTLGAACRNHRQEPSDKPLDSRLAAFEVKVTAFPPDTEVRFDMHGSHMMTTAPAQLKLKEKPNRISAARKGYSGAVLTDITERVFHIELIPDEAQADRLLAEADTIDRLLDYLILFPTLVGRTFYDKLATLMADNASATETNELRDLAGFDLLRDDQTVIRLSQRPRESSKSSVADAYSISFLSAAQPRRAVFERHPARLLRLIHQIDGSTIRFSETSLSHLALSSCDCFLFKVTLEFHVQGTTITFEDVIYERPDKGNPSDTPMFLRKRIGTDVPQSDSNK